MLYYCTLLLLFFNINSSVTLYFGKVKLTDATLFNIILNT